MNKLRRGSLALWVGRPGTSHPPVTVMIIDIIPPRIPGGAPSMIEVMFIGSTKPEWVSPHSLISLEEEEE